MANHEISRVAFVPKDVDTWHWHQRWRLALVVSSLAVEDEMGRVEGWPVDLIARAPTLALLLLAYTLTLGDLWEETLVLGPLQQTNHRPFPHPQQSPRRKFKVHHSCFKAKLSLKLRVERSGHSSCALTFLGGHPPSADAGASCRVSYPFTASSPTPPIRRTLLSR